MWTMMLMLACGDEPKPTPEPVACTPTAWFQDADSDGFGDPFVEVSACEAPDGMVDNYDDCDDTDASAHPGAIWFRDLDGDGYGDSKSKLIACAQPVGHIVDKTDCDDDDAERYPGAVWYTDADDDGYGDMDQEVDACSDVSEASPTSGDCDDSDWFIHPMANEACDEIDNDCDGLVDDDDPDVDIFTQVLMYLDADGDGWGVTDEFLGHLCSSYPGGAERSGDCDDSDAMIYPHRLDFNDEIDSDCDGEPGHFYASTTEYGWAGSSTGSAFGAVIDAKDIDGDGRNEVLVGAYNEGEYVGSIKLIPGELRGDRTSFPEEGLIWDGEQDDDRIGYSIDFAGDWDGDGIEDIVVGSPYRDEYTGLAYIFSSELPAGSLSDASLKMENLAAESYFGHAVLGLGDINDDGLDDVLISARKDSRSEYSNAGSIVVAYGGDTEMMMPPEERTIFGETNNDQLGYALAAAGDPDGDGMSDFLVGAPYCDDGENNGGCAFLMSADDLDEALGVLDGIPRFYGMVINENVGLAVGTAGDVDGDGLDDLLIAGSNRDVTVSDVTVSDVGAAYVMLGSTGGWESTSLADAHLVMLGISESDKTGRYLNGIGDINGDGKQDLAISAVTADVFGEIEAENMGIVYGVLGRSEPATIELALDADFQILGRESNDYLGKGIARAGDVNDDGLDDFWLGANGDTSYGSIYLLEGVEAP